ncbi:SEP domain-containing protein [Mycena epipterygia]|nr:SEP domain-containing protein [Mycena epipterygia]
MSNANGTNGRTELGGTDNAPMEERARSGPGISVQNPYRAKPDGDTVREPLGTSTETGAASAPPINPNTIRHLTFWRDGFTIEHGPLMLYDVPANTEILAAIQSGNAPPAVFNVPPGTPIEVIVANRTTEVYVAPSGA